MFCVLTEAQINTFCIYNFFLKFNKCPFQRYLLYKEKRPLNMVDPESRFHAAINPRFDFFQTVSIAIKHKFLKL